MSAPVWLLRKLPAGADLQSALFISGFTIPMNNVFTSTGTRQTLHLTFPNEYLEGLIGLEFATQFVYPKVSGLIPCLCFLAGVSAGRRTSPSVVGRIRQ
jgi:hypothetical protein